MWIRVDFKLFHTTWATNFWWLLIMEAGAHHLIIAYELVRALIWVSHFVIDIWITLWICGRNLAYISIRLWHSSHVWNTTNDVSRITCFIAACKVVSMILRAWWYHCRCSILISDSMFGSLTFLVLYEVIMSSLTVVCVGVVPSMLILHLLRQLFVADSNHWSLCICYLSSFLLLLLAIRSNKHDIALIYTSIIWAAVRSLFIASPQACSTSIIESTNWVSTHVLIGWSEVEKWRAIWFMLACSCGNVSSIWGSMDSKAFSTWFLLSIS